MKVNKSGIKVLCLAVCLFCFSCASTPEKQIDSVYVMVYDYENNEVMNALISIDGESVGNTDIYGRLIFPFEREKEVFIKASKLGYETVEMRTVIKPGIVIYFKAGSGSYYASQAEKLLDERDINSAAKMIEKALKIEDRKDWSYIQKIIIREKKKDE